MTWPFHFDLDRLAEIVNSVISTLTAATVIFIFIYYNRKKPIFKITTPQVRAGRVGATQLITDPVPYFCTIIFSIENDSIYTAYNFRLTAIDPIFPNGADFPKEAVNLKSSESKVITINFYFQVAKSEIMKGRPDDWASDSEYTNDLVEKFTRPFFINLSYRNDDNRFIKKKLLIKPPSF
jgi:hypothetical protein